MKKIYQIVMLCAMVVALASCDTRSQAEKEHDKADELEAECIEAVNSGDFSKAHGLLAELKTIGQWGNYDRSISLVYQKEIQTLIASNDEDVSDQITFLMQEYPIEGVRQEKGLGRYSVGVFPYEQSCIEYNKLCDKALTLALNRRNEQLARTIVNLYKENPHRIDGSGHEDDAKEVKDESTGEIVKVDGNHSYLYYDYASRDAALKKVEIAFGQE